MRLLDDGDPDVALIADNAARWIEIDPALARQVGLNPSVSIAAHSVVSLVVIRHMEVAGDETRSNAERTQDRDHKHGEVAATPAPERERPKRVLDSLLMSGRVLKVCVDGLRHISEKFARACRPIAVEELRGPPIELRMKRPRRHEMREVVFVLRMVSQRKNVGEILDISITQFRRHMI
jgi:hypothetical protein